MRVGISISVARYTVPWPTAKSLLELDTDLLDVRYFSSDNSNISEKRNEDVREFLKWEEGEYLFIMDDDMVLPRHTLQRLLSHDVQVVSALNVMRIPPYFPAVWTKNLAIVEHRTDFPLDKPFVTDVVGAAALLVRRDVFERIPPPWFDHSRVGEIYVSEDVYFCDQLRWMGIPIWVDPSVQTGHIGQKIAYLEDWSK